ncbi:MAG: MaoC family dehydratase [Gammaproteobacteria bacterium]|nr:MaoC family dehydratase [Gammaproteobacteria bacterium]
MVVTVSSIEDGVALDGEEIGVSDWMLIDQDRINRFADATDDHQWIHVDAARAERELPIGSTIAHGYLLVSLIPALVDHFMRLERLDRAINFGVNKVRFKNMVAAGSRVRLRSKVLSARRRAGALQTVLEHTMEIEGENRPAMVAETIAMYFFEEDEE